jgi:hypothetical protein
MMMRYTNLCDVIITERSLTFVRDDGQRVDRVTT